MKSLSSVSRMTWCGLPAEKACFIFSIINMIIVSTCVAACIYYMGWIMNFLINPHSHSFDIILDLMLWIILSVCTAVAFLFAVLLYYGAHKKRPEFIKAYFVFGVIAEILSTAGAICYLIYIKVLDIIWLPPGEIVLISVWSTIIAIYYPLSLSLVYRAYRVLSDSTVLPSGHGKLIHN